MTLERSISEFSVGELVKAIAGDHGSPGAGSAAAVTLALAAACAAKACSVSLKHQPDDPELKTSFEAIEELAHRALSGADQDAEAFDEYLQERNDAVARQLVRTDQRLAALTSALNALITDIQPRIHRTMAGDLFAAQLLARSAQRIHEHNIEETSESPQSPGG